MKISLLFMWMWKCEPSKNLQTDILKEGPTKRSRAKGNERWGLWKNKGDKIDDDWLKIVTHPCHILLFQAFTTIYNPMWFIYLYFQLLHCLTVRGLLSGTLPLFCLTVQWCWTCVSIVYVSKLNTPFVIL